MLIVTKTRPASLWGVGLVFLYLCNVFIFSAAYKIIVLEML